jgi:hypothetical protein
MYSRSNLPTKEGLDTFVGCYVLTAYMHVERVGGRLPSIPSAEVPVQVMDWIKSRNLEGTPDQDEGDSRPYLTRVWAAHQKLLKQKSELFPLIPRSLADTATETPEEREQ